MARLIRPSTTRSTVALWTKSALNTVLFFAVFMIALPSLANWALPQQVPLPFFLRAIAAGILFCGGIAVWVICVDRFSRQGRGTPFPLDAPQRLVTTGPFAVVRNPIIAAEAAVVWGIAFYLSSLGVLLYAVLFMVAGHVAVVYGEEPELRARFGEEFEAYCRRVPRWLPRSWR